MKNDQLAITAMRVLTAEAVQRANSGHPGLAIGSAPAAFTLWKQMKHNPKKPELAGARPLRALVRPCVDARVYAAAPVRLRADH